MAKMALWENINNEDSYTIRWKLFPLSWFGISSGKIGKNTKQKEFVSQFEFSSGVFSLEILSSRIPSKRTQTWESFSIRFLLCKNFLTSLHKIIPFLESFFRYWLKNRSLLVIKWSRVLWKFIDSRKFSWKFTWKMLIRIGKIILAIALGCSFSFSLWKLIICMHDRYFTDLEAVDNWLEQNGLEQYRKVFRDLGEFKLNFWKIKKFSSHSHTTRTRTTSLGDFSSFPHPLDIQKICYFRDKQSQKFASISIYVENSAEMLVLTKICIHSHATRFSPI